MAKQEKPVVSVGKQKSPPLGNAVSAFIEQSLKGLLADQAKASAIAEASAAALPKNVVSQLKAVLNLPVSYRDGIIIQLAFGLKSETPLDLTKRPEGGRAVAGRLGRLFGQSHIAKVEDAYQNIAKNSIELCRGNQPQFDAFLTWANGASAELRMAAFEFTLATISLTARPVLPMPELDRKALTFFAVNKLLGELLSKPSGGAYQQFAVAAFLHSVVEEFGLGGPGGLRVATKNINAADASSKVVGDIQLLRGNRLEEAFEVTANEWTSKIESAIEDLKNGDLQRIHILAACKSLLGPDGEKLLGGRSDDLTVIDVASFLQTVVAVMRRPARDAALGRLYELLDRHQPDMERVNEYVRLLSQHGLTAAGPREQLEGAKEAPA